MNMVFWLLTSFEHGIPSHDTPSAVFRALDPAAFMIATLLVISLLGAVDQALN